MLIHKFNEVFSMCSFTIVELMSNDTFIVISECFNLICSNVIECLSDR